MAEPLTSPGEAPVELSADHLAAIERPRRIVVHFDVIMGDGANFPIKDIDDLLAFKFEWADDPALRLDSMWWDWNEGHQAPFPSRTQVLIDAPGFRRWADDGINIMRTFLEASQDRGLENFYLYRINGSDNDLGPVSPIPMKEQHPELLINTWNANGYWNFAFDEVHDYKLGILREVAEDYDYDGITLDFARIPLVLPWGRQWELRDRLTAFMRKVRRMTLDVAEARGRPLLLAVRVPENLMGCHFDGIDIETWARELLVDLMVIGCRSFDVDIAAFRRITAGTPIKLYPAIDDHHSSDGYMWPPVEVFRGVFANWFHQGADGVQTFNWEHSSLESAERIGLKALNWPAAEAQRTAYIELAEPDGFHRKDKTFVVQRRGGGHGPIVIPNPEAWYTPRNMYFNSNMFAPLPAPLAWDGAADTLLTLNVADDLAGEAEHLAGVDVRVLLSDPSASALPDDERLDPVEIAQIGHPDRSLMNDPPARAIANRVEVRLNNLRLGPPTVQDGWLVYPARPEQFAVGENLVGVRLSRGTPGPQPVQIEKLEAHVRYRNPSG